MVVVDDEVESYLVLVADVAVRWRWKLGGQQKRSRSVSNSVEATAAMAGANRLWR